MDEQRARELAGIARRYLGIPDEDASFGFIVSQMILSACDECACIAEDMPDAILLRVADPREAIAAAIRNKFVAPWGVSRRRERRTIEA